MLQCDDPSTLRYYNWRTPEIDPVHFDIQETQSRVRPSGSLAVTRRSFRYFPVEQSNAAIAITALATYIVRMRVDHMEVMAGASDGAVYVSGGSKFKRTLSMREDGSLLVEKSGSLSHLTPESQTESEIANLVSLRYSLIASPIGFAESTAPRRLKIMRLLM
jgi:hypothetical protein